METYSPIKMRSPNGFNPPWVLRLLKRVCPDELYEMIEGDLIEQFEDDVERHGSRLANRQLILSSMKFFNHYLWVSVKRKNSVGYLKMSRHFVTTSYRHLSRNKILTFINIVGLAVGFAAFFLIARYVSFETSYDNFHANKDSIYRVAYHQDEGGEHELASALNFLGMPHLIRDNLPEVEAATAFDRSVESAYFQFIYDGKTYHQQGSFYQTDSSFFKVFPSFLLRGDPNSVLSDPHNLVISQKMATMLFGNDDPIGKKIENRSYSMSEAASFVITGVMIDIPENSHFHVNIIAQDFRSDASPAEYWVRPEAYTYVTLRHGVDPAYVTRRINFLLSKIATENPNTEKVTVSLQPIESIHNHSALSEELEANGNVTLLYVLSAIALAILICAWINYVNIESGILISRTKEIGVRKILGSNWIAVLALLYTEYLLTTIAAIILALMAWLVFQQPLDTLMNLPHFEFWASPVWNTAVWFFILGVFITGLVPPLASVKSQGQMRNSSLKKGLVVFQFTASISLIAILMIVHNQLDLLMHTNKKIDIENIISIRNPTVYTNDDSVTFVEYDAFRNQLLSNSMIKQATGSSSVPGMPVEVTFTGRVKRLTTDPYDITPYKILFIDYDYLPFYDLRLKAGRNFAVDNGDDQSWTTVIANETAAKALGFKSAEEAADGEFYFHLWGDDFKKYKIVGIVEDYLHESASKSIEPTILSLNHRYFQQVFYSVKLNKGVDSQEALTFIEATWNKVFPDKPFHYFFQDEYYDRQFKAERRFASIFGLFAGTTIVIACLGIVGMTLFETRSRLKEVTIRKVLGASVLSLIRLLSSSYVRLTLIAILGSIPIITYFSQSWLNSYSIKIEMSAWFYVAPTIIIILMIAFSSGWQMVKAAVINPVDHLRHE